MSKKVILNEEQFKQYMKRMLNENNNMNCGDITASYNYYSEILQRYASYLKIVGNDFNEVVKLIISALQTEGFNVIDAQVQEIMDKPALLIKLDDSQVDFSNEEDYEEQYRGDFLSTRLDNALSDIHLPRFFENVSVSYFDQKSGYYRVDIDVEEEFSIEHIKHLIPDV